MASLQTHKKRLKSLRDIFSKSDSIKAGCFLCLGRSLIKGHLIC